MTDEEVTAILRRKQQDRQNAARRERYRADPAYRAKRLAVAAPYVAAANARRSIARAERKQH